MAPSEVGQSWGFSAGQYLWFVTVAFSIWLAGVVLVRILDEAFFEDRGLVLILLFVGSILLGVVTQFALPHILRLPARDTLVPLVVIAGAALMMDGLAVGFTDIYSSDDPAKVGVGAWLLWTFGTQLVISLRIIHRADR